MDHMDSATSDREQHAITTHDHLPNLLRELVVFRRQREAFGDKRELSENRFA